MGEDIAAQRREQSIEEYKQAIKSAEVAFFVTLTVDEQGKKNRNTGGISLPGKMTLTDMASAIGSLLGDLVMQAKQAAKMAGDGDIPAEKILTLVQQSVMTGAREQFDTKGGDTGSGPHH